MNLFSSNPLRAWLLSGCLLAGPAGAQFTATPTSTWTPNPACCLPVTSWGSPGTLAGQLNEPLGLSTAGTILYVADSGNNRVQRFNLTGAALAPLTGGGTLNNPFGVNLAADGYLFVTDQGNNRVVKIDPASDQITPVVNPAPTTNLYAGIYTDKNGGIYIVLALGSPNGSVLKYTETSPGVFSQAASLGGFNIPNDVLTSDNGVTLYVVDSSDELIKRYLETPPGSNNYVFDVSVVQDGSNPGQITWGNQLAKDPWGNFYVTDTNERHQVFDPNWNFLYQCVSTATPNPSTYGMAVDGSGNVYRGNNAGFIEKFQMCFPSPTPTPTPSSTGTATPTQTPPSPPTGTPAPPDVSCDDSYAYPNPVAGNSFKIHLHLCSPGRVTIFLYSTIGDKVEQASFTGGLGPNDFSLDTSTLAYGIYYYSIEVDGPPSTRRLKPKKFAVTR